ncbi:hypothetical protein KR009_003149 [Drosophila setifemur]|nr:hypothetical protein KR009_003149 [Drosophila setifemur]
MQRSVIRKSCSRIISKINQLPKGFHTSTLELEDLEEFKATGDPFMLKGCFMGQLDLMVRMLQDRLPLMSARPLHSQFFQQIAGNSSTLNYGSEEDDEFRLKLGMQLKELREALHGNRDMQENRGESNAEQDEDTPYTTSQDVRDGSPEELERMRVVRMSARKGEGEDQGRDQDRDQERRRNRRQEDANNASEGSGESRAEDNQEGPDDAVDPNRQMREGEIQGVYWTGEGKRLVTEQREKDPNEGYIRGDGLKVGAGQGERESSPKPKSTEAASSDERPKETSSSSAAAADSDE